MTQGEKGSLEQLATQVVELNLRYYRALGEATMDYVRSVLTFVGDRSPMVRNVASRARQAATTVAATAAAAPPQPAATPVASAIVLEAAGGEEAAGGFLVNNRLSRRVSAAFRISPFLGPSEEPFAGTLQIDPPMLTLEPGMQMVVRITATIPRTIPPAAEYHGTISVPGLAEAPIEVIIRRRAETAGAAQPASTKKPAPPRPRAKSASKPVRRTPRGRR